MFHKQQNLRNHKLTATAVIKGWHSVEKRNWWCASESVTRKKVTETAKAILDIGEEGVAAIQNLIYSGKNVRKKKRTDNCSESNGAITWFKMKQQFWRNQNQRGNDPYNKEHEKF